MYRYKYLYGYPYADNFVQFVITTLTSTSISIKSKWNSWQWTRVLNQFVSGLIKQGRIFTLVSLDFDEYSIFVCCACTHKKNHSKKCPILIINNAAPNKLVKKAKSEFYGRFPHSKIQPPEIVVVLTVFVRNPPTSLLLNIDQTVPLLLRILKDNRNLNIKLIFPMID